MIVEDLLTTVQYALLEAPNGGRMYESGLWTVDEIDTALDLRQQRLLKTTHMQVGIVDIPGVIGQHRYDLPRDWLATVMVAWDIAASGTVPRKVRELPNADMYQADLGQSTWETATGIPRVYSDEDTPTRTLQLLPAPNAAGTIILLYVPLAPRLQVQGEVLQVPNEWCAPVLKYAVLANALSKVGRAHDPQRAQYCEWRVRLGEEVTKLLLGGMG